MNKEGLISSELKRDSSFRSKGLFSFDNVYGYDLHGDKQVNIPGLELKANLTFDKAYDIVVKYFKKEKVLKK